MAEKASVPDILELAGSVKGIAASVAAQKAAAAETGADPTVDSGAVDPYYQSLEEERAYKEAVAQTTDAVTEFAMTLLQFPGFLGGDEEVIHQLAAFAAPHVMAGQHTVARLTNAHLAKALRLSPRQRASVLQLTPDALLVARPGVDKVTELTRPFWTAVAAKRNGANDAEAMAAGVRRMHNLVDTDLQMAKVRESRSLLKAAGRKRYRRITGGSPCALCAIAATQTYYVEDLLPIHNRCHCGVAAYPQDGQAGLDSELDPQELIATNDQLKLMTQMAEDDASPERYRKLIAVREHGEVGPQLTWAHQGFAGPKSIEELNWRNQQDREGYRRRAAERRAVRGLAEPRYAREIFEQDVYDTVQANGGVTIDLGGNRPVAGYAYAFSNASERVVAQTDWSIDDIDDYIDAHFDELSKPGNHLGLWTEEGNVYIDVSQVGPPTAATIAKAQRAKQLAVFDLDEFNTINVGELRNGRYVDLDEATDIHHQYRRQVEGTAEAGSSSGLPEVPRGAEQGLTAAALMTTASPEVLASRPIATDVGGTTQAGRALALRHPGLQVRLKDTDPTVAQDFSRGLDDMITKYPQADLKLVATADLPSNLRMAETRATQVGGPGGDIESEIVLNSNLGTKPGELSVAYHDSADLGFHPPLPTEFEPAYAVAVHEYAHALDNAGGRVARAGVNDELRAEFLRQHPNITAADLSELGMRGDYNRWLGKELYGYSFMPGSSAVNGPEALAVAFADVELNGAKATGASKALHRLLIDSADAKTGVRTGVGPPSRTVDAAEARRAAPKKKPAAKAATKAPAKKAAAKAPAKKKPRASALNDEDLVSVAENVMEDAGQGGREFDIPRATTAEAKPLGLEPRELQRQHSKEAEDFVESALGSRVRVEPEHWDLRGGGQATTDGASYIGIAGTHTNAMTLLHEVAHIQTHTEHGVGGHGPEFQRAARALYESHIHPEAAETFSGVVGLVDEDSAPAAVARTEKQAREAIADAEAKAPALAAATKAGAKSIVNPVADPGYGSVLKRVPNGTTIEPVAKLDKDGKPVMVAIKDEETKAIIGHKPQIDVRATWDSISDDTLKENWRQALRASQPWAVATGKVWYPEVNRLVETLTAKYGKAFEKEWGVELTPDLVAAIFAAYSENNVWAGNLVGVRKFLDGSGGRPLLPDGSLMPLSQFDYADSRAYIGKTGKAYDFHVNKSLRAMQNPEGGVADLRAHDDTAPKPADFAANIAGDYDKATADRWVARIMLHTDDADFAEKLRGASSSKTVDGVKTITPYGYRRMSGILQEVAAEPEFAHLANAAAIQAVPWVQVVGPKGSIGYVEDLTSITSVNAEVERRAAEFGTVG